MKERIRSLTLPWVLVGGLGFLVLLLCLALVLASSGGLYLYKKGAIDLEAAFTTPTPSPEATHALGTTTVPPTVTLPASSTPLPSPTITAVTPTMDATPFSPLPTPTVTATPTLTSTVDGPHIGPLTFAAGVRDDGSLVSPGDTFGGNTREIHAVFEYSGLSGDMVWKTVWKKDGENVTTSSETWPGEESGVYDHYLSAGEGYMDAGEWSVEMYIDDELLSEGSFTIAPALPTSTPVPGADTTPTATPSPTPVPVSSYRILFTRWDGGKHSIWAADADGGNQVFLLDFAASPCWTRDGKVMFFGESGIAQQEKVLSGSDGLWTMLGDGSGATQLVLDGTIRYVSCSPTGNLVTYDTNPAGFRSVVIADPSDPSRPVQFPGEQPAWSPDGEKVAYRACLQDGCRLYVTGRDGTGTHSITSDVGDAMPAWSPDGGRIAFASQRHGNWEIYVLDLSNYEVTRITREPATDAMPAWTPDGARILFRSTRDGGGWGVWVMNADGTDPQLVVGNTGSSDEWGYERISAR